MSLRSFVDYESPVFDVLGVLPPNAWTLLTLASSAVSGWHYYHGSFLLGALFLGVSVLTDVADGGVAKHSGRATRFGAVFDATLDRLGEGLVCIGIARHHFIAFPAFLVAFVGDYASVFAEHVLGANPGKGIPGRFLISSGVIIASLSGLMGPFLYAMTFFGSITLVWMLKKVKSW